MAAIGEPHRIIDFCDDLPGTARWKILRIEIMQLKGLAVKETPIYADSAVIRHEQLSRDCKGKRKLFKIRRKSQSNDVSFQSGVSATCLSVGTLPNTDRCHLRLSNYLRYGVE